MTFEEREPKETSQVTKGCVRAFVFPKIRCFVKRARRLCQIFAPSEIQIFEFQRDFNPLFTLNWPLGHVCRDSPEAKRDLYARTSRKIAPVQKLLSRKTRPPSFAPNAVSSVWRQCARQIYSGNLVQVGLEALLHRQERLCRFLPSDFMRIIST